MTNVLFVSSTTACFEMQNESPYYAPRPVNVTLNGDIVLAGVTTNVFSLFSLAPDTQYRLGVDGEEIAFKTLPESGCVDAKAFGAVGDGKSDDTAAIQNCIEACPKGGRVFIPDGEYVIAPIILKSDMTLELSAGCRLIGSVNEADYPVLDGYETDEEGNKRVLSTWEGNVCASHRSLISGYGLKNVYIVGRGMIDGNAQNSTWWVDVRARKIARPRLVFLNGCKNVTFHGITGGNSASWNFQPFLSENVNFYDMRVVAPKRNAPNTDGIDPDCCSGVDIIGCQFSTGDDCIAIKSGKIDLAFLLKRPADRHTVRNCLMKDGHGAVVLGSEIGGGVRDLSVSKCVFEGTDRGLRIKTRRGRGKYCVIDGVRFENIRMHGVVSPLVINMYYNCDPDGNTEYVYSREMHPVDERTPYLGKFTFQNIRCDGCKTAAGYFDGLPEQPIKEIVFDDVSFSYDPESKGGYPAMMTYPVSLCKAGLYFDNVERVKIGKVTFDGLVGDEIIAKNCKEIVRGE